MSPAETRLVLGTAGHIDHGKTELCRALTGVDTDRLPEERERGITIVLGFAPLDLPGGRRVSVIDVPGHEGLVRTMVAGATGIDLVLLVVAADEGVMPQTREHVAICDLLGITRGVVALTKLDLVEAEVADLAAEEVEELLADTGLGGSPIVRVSTRTGEGLDALRAELSSAVEGASARTARSGAPRLSVDRHFAPKGFGCVVTGTLVGGAFRVGDTVELQPSGHRGRVRGIQNHGEAAKRGEPGLRCAVNLQGVEVADVARGDVLTLPDAVAPTRTVDVTLAWLDVAPAVDEPASVEFLAGTAERRARVAPIGAPVLAPGSRSFARIHIEGDPVPLFPGDRFILRGFARTGMGGSTLGGGLVLDTAPLRRRRSDPSLVADLTELEKGDAASGVRVRIARSGLAGVARDRLVRETGLEAGAFDAVVGELSGSGEIAVTSHATWLAASAVEAVERRLVEALDAFHAAEPIRPGMPIGALRGAVPTNAAAGLSELALERLVAGGAVAIEGEIARRADHRVTLSPEDRALADRIATELLGAGLETPPLQELGQRVGADRERLREVLAHMEREGKLVRAPGELWFDREAVDALRERVVARLKEKGRLETLEYKDLIGTSRRTAVPLMEFFDEERVTLRSGNARLLRGG